MNYIFALPVEKKNQKTKNCENEKHEGDTGEINFWLLLIDIKVFFFLLFCFTIVIQWLYTDKKPSSFSCQILSMEIKDSPRERSYAHVLFNLWHPSTSINCSNK